jgi:energy-converting hydrogenase Eha subunit F
VKRRNHTIRFFSLGLGLALLIGAVPVFAQTAQAKPEPPLGQTAEGKPQRGTIPYEEPGGPAMASDKRRRQPIVSEWATPSASVS